MKNKNNKRTNEKKEQIKIKLTIFLIIFASIFAFITAYQSTKIVMTTLELSYMYAGEEVEENNPISFLNSNTYLIEGQKYNIDINITDNEQKANFSLEILLNNEQIKKIEWNDAISISTTVDISDNFHIEGENVVTVIIYKDGQIYQKAESTVSYIRKYVEQFAEKLYHKGIGTHFSFRTFGAEKMELVDALGATYIRDDMMIEAIDKGNGRYDYWNYDDWINNAKDDDISLYALLRANRTNGLLGENGKVTNNDEVTRYVKFAENVATRYPQISDFEVLNEPNGYYTSEEDAYWYTELLKKTAETLKNLNNDYKIWAGATMTVDPRNDTRMTSIEFFNRIFKNGAYKYTNCFSYHIYDSEPNSKNQWFKNKLQEHRQLFNEQGGFVNVSISEFGVTTYSNKITEDEKADRIIKQYILLDNYHIENSLLYNFRDTGTNIDNRESNFGIVSYTFTPKPAYYAMKNYYQNTNGSEYIGTIRIRNTCI